MHVSCQINRVRKIHYFQIPQICNLGTLLDCMFLLLLLINNTSKTFNISGTIWNHHHFPNDDLHDFVFNLITIKGLKKKIQYITKQIRLHNCVVWPSETPTSVDFQRLKVIQIVSIPASACLLSHINISLLFKLTMLPSFGRNKCAHLFCQAHAVWPNPTRLNFFCKHHLVLWPWADGSTCQHPCQGICMMP